MPLPAATRTIPPTYRIVRPSDGQTRWIDVVAKIERDSEGRALRLVGAHIDATDRMLAQEKLRESEQRFRLIADSAPVPIWVTKLDRTRSFANQAYVDFLGLPFEEAIAFDWRKILHPDDQQRVVQESIAGEASLKPFVLEARYRDADGEWRWLRSESQPRWDPTGNHIGFIGVAHDITAAKQAEHDLRRLNEILELRITERTAQLESNEAQMRAIFETSHQYQALLNQHGDVLYANKTALAGIRTEASAVLGKPFWDTPWFSGTEGMGNTVRDAFVAVMRGEEVQTEMLLRLPIGERYFDFTMRPLRDQHGAIIGAVPDAVDITERRQGEEALRQSQKMEAVGQLTGGVAHDFNNLLTIIRSATDFLRRRELPEERRRRYIDAISETVERASKLTGQLLAFARRQPLKPQVFNVGTQVEAVAQLVRPLDVDPDPAADQRTNQLRHGLDLRADIEHLRLQRLPAGKRQQLPGQLGGAFHGFGDRVDVAAAALLRQFAAAQEIGGGADDGQEIVEIVRDAAGELADRFHLLRLAQRFLALAALGDVDGFRHRADDGAVLVAQRAHREVEIALADRQTAAASRSGLLRPA